MMRGLARLVRASPQERRAARAAARWLIAAKLLHLRLDAPGILARLSRPAGRGRGIALPEPRAMNWALAAVSRRLPWRSDCLVQALAGKLWLEAAGVDAELHLGAARDDDGAIAAHAWLTVGGEVAAGGDGGPGLARFSEAGADATGA